MIHLMMLSPRIRKVTTRPRSSFCALWLTEATPAPSMTSGGKGVPQDYAEAAKWYRLAADQGFAKAQNSLGAQYATGEGVPPAQKRANDRICRLGVIAG